MLQLNATLLNSGSLKKITQKKTHAFETYMKHITHMPSPRHPCPLPSKAMIFQRIFNGPSPRMIAAFKLHVDDMATKTKKHLLHQMQMPFCRQLLKTSSSFRLQGPHNIHVYIRVWDAIPDYRSNSFGPLWFFFGPLHGPFQWSSFSVFQPSSQSFDSMNGRPKNGQVHGNIFSSEQVKWL